jgi:hypothetical protein
MSQRNYTGDALAIFVDDLDADERTRLLQERELPSTYKDLQPTLTSKDVARMIQLLEGGEKPETEELDTV